MALAPSAMLAQLLLVLACLASCSLHGKCDGDEHGSACEDEASLARVSLLQRDVRSKQSMEFVEGTRLQASPVTSDYKRPKDAPTLPLLAPAYRGLSECDEAPCSEQVHIQLGGPGEMVVVFASNYSTRTSSAVTYWRRGAKHDKKVAQGNYRTYSAQYYFTSNWIWGESPMGPGPNGTQPTVEDIAEQLSSDDWAYYGNDTERHVPHIWKKRDADWVSENIKYPGMFGDYWNPKQAYESPQIHSVSISGLLAGVTYEYQVANLRTVFFFTMPKFDNTDFDVAYPLTLGIFSDVGQTRVSLDSIAAMKKLKPDVALIAGDLSYADGYYPRWDSFGNMIQSLSAYIPIMTCPGNHEYGYGENFQSYNIRYPMPYRQSGSPNPNFWSRDMGPVHVISMNSYAATHYGSEQREWMVHDLSSVDRQRTPWVIVMMHVPWYNSNIHHLMEGKVMRDNMEDTFFQHNVNLVIAGHVHAFEATHPLYKNATNRCGPTYLTTGDSGNYEGINLDWLDGDAAGEAPSWTAFRQSSFGVGTLTVESRRKLRYIWRRNYCYDEDGQTPDYSKDCATDDDNSEHAHRHEYAVTIFNSLDDPSCSLAK